jgi:pimeloyl-ACP methyl ester carboxylesterase
MPTLPRPALAVLVAVACGNDRGAPLPIDAPVDANPALLTFTPCRDAPRQCANLVVPVDYSDATAGTLTLPIVRMPAQDAANRIGVLAFNFGGPGEPTAEPISNEWPQQPIDSTTDLTQQFDFIAIDWRGVATSQPGLSCLDGATTAALGSEEFAPGSAADWTALFDLVAAVGSGCTAQTPGMLLAHVDTVSAARDFDALRAGLGEDKLNLWVVSYGTRLGEMYADLFPDRVRAIVLDSPMPPTADFEGLLQAQSESFENELQRFFAWCAGTTAAACPFQAVGSAGSAGSAADIAAAYEALLAAADTAPQVADGLTLDRPTIDETVLGELYFPSVDWPALAQQLAALGSGSGGPLAMAGAGVYDYNGDDNAFAGLLDIFALDFPIPAAIDDGSDYEAWALTQATVAPHFGLQDAASTAFSLALPTAMPAEPAIGATTAPPLLVTATRNDPATPYADAPAVVTALANGSYLVTYEGDGHANGEFDACLGDVTAAFLVDPTTPPATTDCADIQPSARPARRSPFARRGRRW